MLTEALLLALLGGVASLVVATWTLDGIAALLPTSMAATLRLTLNPTVILFTGVVAVLTGLLFGLFPALHATRTDLITTIRAGAGQIIGGRGAARFRAGLATAQIALAMTLLVMAGLFLKSLTNIAKVDLGVAIDDVVTFNVTPSRVGYDTTRAGLFLRRIEEELAAIPGVTGMTSSMVPLLGGSNWGTNVRVQGFPATPTPTAMRTTVGSVRISSPPWACDWSPAETSWYPIPVAPRRWSWSTRRSPTSSTWAPTLWDRSWGGRERHATR